MKTATTLLLLSSLALVQILEACGGRMMGGGMMAMRARRNVGRGRWATGNKNGSKNGLAEAKATATATATASATAPAVAPTIINNIQLDALNQNKRQMYEDMDEEMILEILERRRNQKQQAEALAAASSNLNVAPSMQQVAQASVISGSSQPVSISPNAAQTYQIQTPQNFQQPSYQVGAQATAQAGIQQIQGQAPMNVQQTTSNAFAKQQQQQPNYQVLPQMEASSARAVAQSSSVNWTPEANHFKPFNYNDNQNEIVAPSSLAISAQTGLPAAIQPQNKFNGANMMTSAQSQAQAQANIYENEVIPAQAANLQYQFSPQSPLVSGNIANAMAQADTRGLASLGFPDKAQQEVSQNYQDDQLAQILNNHGGKTEKKVKTLNSLNDISALRGMLNMGLSGLSSSPDSASKLEASVAARSLASAGAHGLSRLMSRGLGHHRRFF